ncbi:bone morphogenetic protein 2-like [Colletes gigas]|uniref:bone morphogenetic protein 2-like n=1 Tax=Colletes gigas TaxID=935657 RepID=UPI001C9A7F69|nr:bone morphogenetic protein 2-like [Colletes gigas]
MTGIVPFLLLALLFLSRHLDADAHPADVSEDHDADGRELEDSWSLADLNEGNDHDARRDEALEKLQQVLGIRSHGEKTGRRKVPPQFMLELYNNVADPSGVTRGRNPYNAKVVRSFIERDTSMSRFYFFNITGLEVNESVLEAELHLYRKRTALRTMHPSTVTTPYYLIRVYQVMDEKSLDVPDLHRLLNVRYVGAHASGWQIFNVKQAVLAWLNGEPNLGLLVTATTLFEDQVNVEFSRRNEYHHSKQPILVLFDDDGKGQLGNKKVVPRYYAYGNDNEVEAEVSYDEDDEKIDLKDEYNDKRHDGRHGQTEEARWESGNASEYFQRQKRTHKEDTVTEVAGGSEDAAETTGRRRREVMPSTRNIFRTINVYRRARRREKAKKSVRRRLTSRTSVRQKRSTKSHASVQQNVTECSRHELYVDFKEIGLSSSIIAPLGYSAYYCKGICESPLSQDQQPTNHATIQGIVHKMGLVKGVERPCCVPTKLLGTTILFFDDNENVVLKVYQDMIANRCGCR